VAKRNVGNAGFHHGHFKTPLAGKSTRTPLAI
jgi:hypothetical protein